MCAMAVVVSLNDVTNPTYTTPTHDHDDELLLNGRTEAGY